MKQPIFELSAARPVPNRAHPLRRMTIRVVAALGILGLAAGCSSDDEAPYIEQPVEQLYNGATDELLQSNFEEAARLYDEVERQHPYSVWASKAQLMAAYAFYQDNKYDDAINTLDRFIQLHPGNKDIAYAYYLKAISYYEQISDVARDQKTTRQALESLDEVIRRFPETQYARDAELKIDLARDHLAGKHMEIGRYYLNRGEYLAAINRFRTVVEDYQTTTHVPEALHRLVESYMSIGVMTEAKATASVLGYNFPGSDWYIDSYALLTGEDLRPEEDQDSWISKVWNSVI